MSRLSYIILILTYSLRSAISETIPLTEIVSEKSGIIWGMDTHPQDKSLLFYTERLGVVKSVNLKTKEIVTYSGVPIVYSKGQGGLLDIAFDPKGADLYLSYSEPLQNNSNTTSLFKGRVDLKNKKISGGRIFQSNAISDNGYHFGSRIAISDNYVFLSIGERNDRYLAQQLDKHHGKILRLNKDGSTPIDNPFIKLKLAKPEIYSYGHRNPQGLAFNKEGELYNSEFGPRGGDEINLILPAKNYGWPTITYGKEYWGPTIGTTHHEGMEQPIHYWVPSISPSGIAFYKDTLLLANLSGQHIRKVTIKDKKVIKEEILLGDLNERFRDIHVENDQEIYISTDSGRIIKINL